MSYGGDPLNNPRDEFRLLIGDVDPNAPIFSDGEIDYYIDFYGSVHQGALNAVYALKAKASHCVNENVGSTSKSYSDLIKNYDELIKALESKIGLDALKNASAPIYAGGISKSDKKDKEDNSDRVDPYFTRDTTDSKDAKIEQDY